MEIATCDIQTGRKNGAAPYAFTEHGALMAASVLNTPRAVEVSLYVVRAFVRLRETLAAHKLAFRPLANSSHAPQCQLASHPSRRYLYEEPQHREENRSGGT